MKTIMLLGLLLCVGSISSRALGANNGACGCEEMMKKINRLEANLVIENERLAVIVLLEARRNQLCGSSAVNCEAKLKADDQYQLNQSRKARLETALTDDFKAMKRELLKNRDYSAFLESVVKSGEEPRAEKKAGAAK